MRRVLLVVFLSVVCLIVVGAALTETVRARGELLVAPQALGALAAVQQAQLLAADGVANDLFGSSIAIRATLRW